MPIAACPQANVEQSAMAVGWNFYSQAHGTVNTDNCTAIVIYNAMLAQCQFESARRVRDALTNKVLPDYVSTGKQLVDLTPEECRALTMPLPPAAPVVFQSVPSVAAAPLVCPAPEVVKRAKARGWKRPPQPMNCPR